MTEHILIGKWVVIDEGDSFRVGEVKGIVGDAAYVSIRCEAVHKHPQISQLIPLVSLQEKYNFFFDTEEQLDAWTEWLDTPSDDPKIVEFSKKH